MPTGLRLPYLNAIEPWIDIGPVHHTMFDPTRTALLCESAYGSMEIRRLMINPVKAKDISVATIGAHGPGHKHFFHVPIYLVFILFSPANIF